MREKEHIENCGVQMKNTICLKVQSQFSLRHTYKQNQQ